MSVGKIIKVHEPDDKGGQYKDEFGDSKFGLDLCNYFPREMIQNALDVRLDKEKPLEVTFTFKELETSKVPGLNELKSIIEYCKNTKEVQEDTAEQYEKMLKQIDSGKILCLKVSDRNTMGVVKKDNEKVYSEVENPAWKAMVYSEGQSEKSEQGSGGKHGVGKKVAFIMSSLRTVFYYTHNLDDIEMFMGKSILTNFRVGDDFYKNNIWFGKEGKTEYDYLPLVKGELDGIDPFFYHADEFGTDVIIIGIDEFALETNLERIKKKIIFGILDNFFVALLEGKLVVKVQDEVLSNVNGNNIKEKLQEYRSEYEDEYTKLTRDDYTSSTIIGKSNLQYGNLYNYVQAYEKGDQIEIPVQLEGKEVGKAVLRVIPENSFEKKYFSIFRKQGMKIIDMGPVSGADQAFSAVVEIVGDELNVILGKAENAAHDNFDEWSDSSHKTMYNKMIKSIKKEIQEITKLEIDGEIPIEDIGVASIGYSGDKIQVEVVDKDEDVKVRTINVARKKPSEKKKKTEGEKKKPKRKNKKRKQYRGKVFDGSEYALIEDFEKDPLITYDKRNDEYILSFGLIEPVNNVLIDLAALNGDNKEESIVKEFIRSVREEGKKYKINTELGTVRRDNIPSNKRDFNINIKMKKHLKYQIKANIYTKK